MCSRHVKLKEAISWHNFALVEYVNRNLICHVGNHSRHFNHQLFCMRVTSLSKKSWRCAVIQSRFGANVNKLLYDLPLPPSLPISVFCLGRKGKEKRIKGHRCHFRLRKRASPRPVGRPATAARSSGKATLTARLPRADERDSFHPLLSFLITNNGFVQTAQRERERENCSVSIQELEMGQ